MGGGDRRRRHHYHFHGHRIEAASFLISYLIFMCIWNSANCHSRAVSEMLNQPVTYGRCHLRRSPTMSGTGPSISFEFKQQTISATLSYLHAPRSAKCNGKGSRWNRSFSSRKKSPLYSRRQEDRRAMGHLSRTVL